MNGPANISRYIMLKTTEPLSKEAMQCWFQCAKKYLPSGVVSTVQTTDEKGTLRSACMVDREAAGAHEYYVPLTRDLMDAEAEPVVEAFSNQNASLDFEVEVSSSQTGLLGQNPSIQLADNRFNDLCTGWAKKQHDDWFKDRTESGWRYGTTVSLSNKTHPLLRAWHELPDKFRKVDSSQPQALLDLLNDQGYSIISRNELDGILRLLKGGF